MKEPIARHKERLRDITMCLENELDFIETQLAFLRSVAQKNITAQQDLWEYERQYKTAVRRAQQTVNTVITALGVYIGARGVK